MAHGFFPSVVCLFGSRILNFFVALALKALINPDHHSVFKVQNSHKTTWEAQFQNLCLWNGKGLETLNLLMLLLNP
jgi:hypothetical protein